MSVGARPEVGPSIPTELAWLAHLVAGRVPYEKPALGELAQLLPDLPHRVPDLRSAYAELWPDDLTGSTELLVLAWNAGMLLSAYPSLVLDGLEGACRRGADPGPLETEAEADREAVRGRLARLRTDAGLRKRYVAWFAELWSIAATAWRERGESAVSAVCRDLERRLDARESPGDWLSPRHPAAAIFRSGRRGAPFGEQPIAISPLYFCMSGGTLTALRGLVHLGVPGSSLEPSRKLADATQVASSLKVLSEPARVAVLLHLLTESAGVMEVARRLEMSQPVVSGHLKQLREAGLVAAWTSAGRTVYSTDLGRVERVLGDARALIAHWREAAPG